MTSALQGPLRPTLYRFKLGGFEMMNVLDSFATRDGLGSVHAGGAKPGELEELAKKNNVDPNRFEHPFVPVLVNTGKQLVLFDTGNGALPREYEQLSKRLPPGQTAERLAARGDIRLEPCHHHQTVGPMAGMTTWSMPVLVVENRATGNRAYSNLNEGLGRVLRYGGMGPDVLERLGWIRTVLGPALGEAVRRIP